MEIKTNEPVSFEIRGSRKELTTVETILFKIAFVFMIVVTVMFSYALFEHAKLYLICSEVSSLHSTSNSMEAAEYNKLADKIDHEGYTLSYAVKDDDKIISEKSGNIDRDIPLANGNILTLTFTPKINDNSTSIIMIKQYLSGKIKY